jgi:hypothetical protein
VALQAVNIIVFSLLKYRYAESAFEPPATGSARGA